MKILVPVEDYLYCEAIVNFIMNHQWNTGTSFDFIHVFEPEYLGTTLDVKYQKVILDKACENKKSLIEIIENAINRLKAKFTNLNFEYHVLDGNIVSSILDYSKDNLIDLIICGSSGKNSIKRLFLGSTSLNLITKAKCPVIVIKPNRSLIEHFESLSSGAKLLVKDQIKFDISQAPLKVLIPLDDKSCAIRVVDTLSKHNWQEGTEFLILHVYEPLFSASPMMPNLVLSDYHIALKEQIESLFTEVTQSIKDRIKGSVVKTESIDGFVKDSIIEYCDEKKIDLVVIGQSNKSDFERLLLGSTSLAVLANSKVSCMIIK